MIHEKYNLLEKNMQWFFDDYNKLKKNKKPIPKKIEDTKIELVSAYVRLILAVSFSRNEVSRELEKYNLCSCDLCQLRKKVKNNVKR